MFAYWLYQKSRIAEPLVQGEQVFRTEQEVPLPEESAIVTPQSVLKKVGEQVSLDPLPEGIDPIVAEIVNRDGLMKEDAIFEEAVNGDYFILNGEQLAFYRPSEERVVFFQRIKPDRFVKSPPKEEVSTTTPTPIIVEDILPATIEIRTGALSEAQTAKVGDMLNSLEWVVSLEVESSLRDDYEKTYIINQTNNPGALAELEKRFGGQTVTKVPEDERPSGADFLIIFGP